MQANQLEVIYHAQPQFDRLSEAEKDELAQRLTRDGLRSVEMITASGNAVSRIGSKRVLWKIADDGHPIVLSVVEADAA